MVNFQELSLNTFLKEYWQKKPLVIRSALPGFINPLSPDELAGLALEEDMESRIVFETTDKANQWHLKRGPFAESAFSSLPKDHWTLLVQGVDKVVPEVYALLNHFDFIPQWRLDDVMISYATQHGSVGPHYDNYDVFLYQAQGRRKWSLTAKNCTPENYIPNLELRIMREFDTEEEVILEEGDMLYLPPHIGHYGISLSDDCMTYSFGYRSYQGQELLDSLGEFLSENGQFKTLYHDPDWSCQKDTSELTPPAWQQAQKLLHQLIDDENVIKSWFGCFATQLDHQAEQQLATPLEEDEWGNLDEFISELKQNDLMRDPSCRFAYLSNDDTNQPRLYINGCIWETQGVSAELLRLIANNRFITQDALVPFLNYEPNQLFLHDLWKLQWLDFAEPG
ncbi:cupin domain-containing protein [Legionella worsleiensis]|uniref:Cupin n=1 Tax=Legionella worsleiensis TaxID=45076 RepID=A0A0W1A660_9GAMM|nr:cupin domain-containing protein [Legionella worsleiensis]KTD76804.1 cupin [Legionella worsleiensis]STY30649.1 cupin [Legionella worsleiensis]